MVLRFGSLELSRPNAVFIVANTLSFRRRLSRSHNPKKVKLTLVSMLRNEDRYLLDWLKFHSKIGVDRFVLYLNETDPGCIARIGKIIQSDADVNSDVSLIHWPDLGGPLAALLRPHGHPRRARPTLQELAFRHFFKYLGNTTEYILKIDVDEFIYRSDFEKGGPEIVDLLTFRGTYPIGGYNFGSSGELNYRSEPVPCRFVRRETERTWVKSIAHAETVHEHGYAHHFQGPQLVMDLPLVINHYRIKSRDEYVLNKIHDSGYMAGKYSEEKFEQLDLGQNAVIDDRACQLFSQMFGTETSGPASS